MEIVILVTIYFSQVLFFRFLRFILFKIYNKCFIRFINITLKQINWISVSLIMLFYAYLINYTINPPESYYRDKIEDNFKIELPASTQIIEKQIESITIFFDNNTSALLKMDKNDLQLLTRKLENDGNIKRQELTYYESQIKNYSITAETHEFSKFYESCSMEHDWGKSMAIDTTNGYIYFHWSIW